MIVLAWIAGAVAVLNLVNAIVAAVVNYRRGRVYDPGPYFWIAVLAAIVAIGLSLSQGASS